MEYFIFPMTDGSALVRPTIPLHAQDLHAYNQAIPLRSYRIQAIPISQRGQFLTHDCPGKTNGYGKMDFVANDLHQFLRYFPLRNKPNEDFYFFRFTTLWCGIGDVTEQ